MTRPLVSIITPSYNQARFLEYTICSVLEQDYPNIEYLLVDGGSTDESIEIIQRFADRLAWWISEPDSGQAEAINKGFARARGEFVAWLNSDDLYLPGAISQAVAVFEENPELGTVYGDALTVDAQGRPINWLSFGEWGLEEFIHFQMICQPAVFMRREVLEEAGFLDTAYQFLLDHHLWIRLARLAPVRYVGARCHEHGSFQGRFSAAPWAAARHHPLAKNVSQAGNFGAEAMRLLQWIQDHADLFPGFDRNDSRVMGGALRLSARYYLDGGMPGEALKFYGRALLAWPTYTLRHAHRIAYALLCVFGLGGIAQSLRARVSERKRKKLTAELVNRFPAFRQWVGLCLEL